jgi:hypothetical protein
MALKNISEEAVKLNIAHGYDKFKSGPNACRYINYEHIE